MKMKNKFLLTTIAITIIAMNSFAQVTGTLTDSRDWKVYKTVTIGTQTWMAENLAYKASSGCWAYNDSIKYVSTYGYLYNWATAKTVCPSGWHLPTDAEWTTLTTYLGGEMVAGAKLKSTTNWTSNYGTSNSSGFSALGGGYRNYKGAFVGIGTDGDYWSSSERSTASGAWARTMNYNAINIYRGDYDKVNGYSVRCLKD